MISIQSALSIYHVILIIKNKTIILAVTIQEFLSKHSATNSSLIFCFHTGSCASRLDKVKNIKMDITLDAANS